MTVDCIYVAASARDARYTRICIASIRYFYPKSVVQLLSGGPLQTGLAEELDRYWNIKCAPLPMGDYGWGFVKLEPLFGSPGERFLVLDSDTALAGPILEVWSDSKTSFLVDKESQTEANTKRLYYEWDRLSSFDAYDSRPAFVFNTGQWFGTAGILTRADFEPWLEWSWPRRLTQPEIFKHGEQGLLNYVLNRKAAVDGLAIERRKIMLWPGSGMKGLKVEKVAKQSADPLVIHWAGMKDRRMSRMVGSDVLAFFENRYYSKIPLGSARWFAEILRNFVSYWIDRIGARLLP